MFRAFTLSATCLAALSWTAGPAGAEDGYLGIYLTDMPPASDEADAAKRSPVIRRVEPHSPADRIGLHPGDEIIAFDGQPIRSAAQFRRLVRDTPPGSRVRLQVRNEGRRRNETVTLGARLSYDLDLQVPGPTWQNWGPPAAERWPFDRQSPQLWPGRLGIEYEEISGQLARFFHLEQERGVLVAEVDPKSPAEAAGIRAGDVLLRVGEDKVASGGDIRGALAPAQTGQMLTIELLRKGRRRTVKLRLREVPRPEETPAPKVEY